MAKIEILCVFRNVHHAVIQWQPLPARLFDQGFAPSILELDNSLQTWVHQTVTRIGMVADLVRPRFPQSDSNSHQLAALTAAQTPKNHCLPLIFLHHCPFAWANSGNSGYGFRGFVFVTFPAPGVVAGVLSEIPDALYCQNAVFLIKPS